MEERLAQLSALKAELTRIVKSCAGCAGWSYEDVLPWFRKAEDQQHGASEYHGVGGPLSVSGPAYRHPLADAFIASAVERGYPIYASALEQRVEMEAAGIPVVASGAKLDTIFSAEMLDGGAIPEVLALATRQLDPLLPAMKAHGVPTLIRHLNGEIGRAETSETGRADTRRYAKRQFTWFRHQLPEFEWVAPEAARGWLDRIRGPR